MFYLGNCFRFRKTTVVCPSPNYLFSLHFKHSYAWFVPVTVGHYPGLRIVESFRLEKPPKSSSKDLQNVTFDLYLVNKTMAKSSTSSQFLNPFWDGHFTTSLGTPLQCTCMLTSQFQIANRKRSYSVDRRIKLENRKLQQSLLPRVVKKSIHFLWFKLWPIFLISFFSNFYLAGYWAGVVLQKKSDLLMTYIWVPIVFCWWGDAWMNLDIIFKWW